MKKALISPNELVGLGCRVVQVCDTEFPVAEPLFWEDCPDEVVADLVYYNKVTNEFLPIPAADPVPVTVPQVVTMRQARLALLQSGYLDIVNTAIASMPGTEGEAARIEWEFAETVERSSPLVQAMTAILSLTDAQLDALFTLAGGL